MRLCWIGSDVAREDTFLPGIDITNIVRLCRERFDTLVFGGSSAGLMGTFASEFHAAGGRIVSIVPRWLADTGLAFENGAIIRCETLAQQKDALFASMDALLCYPGGLEAYDALFDHLARGAIGSSRNAPDVYLYNYDLFFAPLLLQLETAAESGFIRREALDRVHVFDTPQMLADRFRG